MCTICTYLSKLCIKVCILLTLEPCSRTWLCPNLEMPRPGINLKGAVLQGCTACSLFYWLDKVARSEDSPEFCQKTSCGPPSGPDSGVLCLQDLVMTSLRGKDLHTECRLLPILMGYRHLNDWSKACFSYVALCPPSHLGARQFQRWSYSETYLSCR